MPLVLPKPIGDYFATDAENCAVITKCFRPDAVVVDEKRTYIGRNAIAAWKAEASAKYDYIAAPVSIDDQDDRVIVTAHLTGNFPGSPVDLRYAFTLFGDEIARLEIVL